MVCTWPSNHTSPPVLKSCIKPCTEYAKVRLHLHVIITPLPAAVPSLDMSRTRYTLALFPLRRAGLSGVCTATRQNASKKVLTDLQHLAVCNSSLCRIVKTKIGAKFKLNLWRWLSNSSSTPDIAIFVWVTFHLLAIQCWTMQKMILTTLFRSHETCRIVYTKLPSGQLQETHLYRSASVFGS